jgi:tRNA A37 threonylcarbamoyladenosine synthetase subunit TsaC/SUA5/YrdC
MLHERPPVDRDEVRTLLRLVIDGGSLIPEESSVISLLQDEAEIIRVGKGDVSAFL